MAKKTKDPIKGLSKKDQRALAANTARNESLKSFNPMVPMGGDTIPLPDYEPPAYMTRAAWLHASETNRYTNDSYIENGFALYNEKALVPNPEARKHYLDLYENEAKTDYDKYRLTKAYTQMDLPMDHIKHRFPAEKNRRKHKVDAISGADGYEEGGPVGKNNIGELANLGADQISDLLMSLVGDRNKTLSDEIAEYRTNPADAMKKQAAGTIAADIATSTAKGAAAGAVGGPITAAVSAGVGALTSGVKAIFGAKGRQDDRAEATSDWSEFWGGRTQDALNESGYAEGGKIKGKGTGKSDSIGMKAPEDAFIVPKENAAAAMQHGKDYLGWKDQEVAGRNYGNIDINVSNGEVFYTPEEYDLLDYYGVDVKGLAPNAEKNKTGFSRGGKTKGFHDGGGVHKHPHEDVDSVNQANQDYLNRDATSGLNTYVSDEMAKIDRQVQGETFREVAKADLPEKESIMDKIMKSVGTIAGAAQVAGGAAGLASSGQRPDINVSKKLESLSRAAKESAGYGLPPAVKNEYKKQSARKMRQVMNSITGQGGSAQDIYKKQIGALSTGLAESGKIEIADYEAKEKKIDRSIGIDLKLAGQEYDVNKIGLASWENDQDLWANLLSTGIEHIIGAGQYNKELEAIKALQKAKETNITLG